MKSNETYNFVDISRRIKIVLIPMLIANGVIEDRKSMANMLGVSVETISRATGKKTETLRRYITTKFIQNICDTFNVRFDWVTSGEEPMFVTSNNDSEDKLSNARQITEEEDYVWIETIKIPEKAGMSLQGNYFSEIYYNNLEKGTVRVRKEHKGEYLEVEATGDSMNNGTINSLQNKDWFLARNIKREYWKTKLHLSKWNLFYILHNERGHIIKEIIDHNVETGDITLHSWNEDKEEYPDFVINLKDCYILANIVRLIGRDYGNNGQI